MQIRMIALDLDGTLLNVARKISSRNLSALRACEQRGIHVVLASGRSFESVRRLAIQYDLRGPIISNNGARVDLSIDGPLLLERTFPPEQARQVFDILKRNQIYFTCYGDGVLYQNNLIYAADKMRGVNLHDMHVMQTHRAERVAADEQLTTSEGLRRAYKFVAFNEDAQKLSVLRQDLADSGLDLNISSSWHDNIEVMSKDAAKGLALGALLDHFGLTRDQLMAFGDNDNDLDMLRAAGHPVAMQNAVPQLKQAAEIIAPHHDDSGVGQVIEEYILNDQTP